MTLWCFLSWGFIGVLLELDEGLYRVLLLDLHAVCGLDLLWSLEWVEDLLHEDDLQCGVSRQKWWVLWQWHEVLPWWHPTISIMWPGKASVEVVTTMTPISMWLRLQPWSAVPVLVLVMASKTWSGAMPGCYNSVCNDVWVCCILLDVDCCQSCVMNFY